MGSEHAARARGERQRDATAKEKGISRREYNTAKRVKNSHTTREEQTIERKREREGKNVSRAETLNVSLPRCRHRAAIKEALQPFSTPDVRRTKKKKNRKDLPGTKDAIYGGRCLPEKSRAIGSHPLSLSLFLFSRRCITAFYLNTRG